MIVDIGIGNGAAKGDGIARFIILGDGLVVDGQVNGIVGFKGRSRAIRGEFHRRIFHTIAIFRLDVKGVLLVFG